MQVLEVAQRELLQEVTTSTRPGDERFKLNLAPYPEFAAGGRWRSPASV